MVNLARTELARYEAKTGVTTHIRHYRIAETVAGLAMESPGLIWIPRSRPASTCPSSSRTRPPTSGSTGSSATTSPPTPLPTRPWPTTTRARRTSPCGPAAAGPIDSTATSAPTRTRCYFEVIYVQGARFLDNLRKDFGEAKFKRAIRHYARDNRFGHLQQRSGCSRRSGRDGRSASCSAIANASPASTESPPSGPGPTSRARLPGSVVEDLARVEDARGSSAALMARMAATLRAPRCASR